MPVYFLIVGKKITQEIDTAETDVTALPLLESSRAMSLLDRVHIIALMNRMDWTAAEVIENMGLVDERDNND